MATQNLSDHNTSGIPAKEVLAEQKYAIAVADWNPNITHALLDGAKETLMEYGVKESNIREVHVPGTFELIYASTQLLGSEEEYAAVIAIGCVIKGETPHFDYICQGVTEGIAHLNMDGVAPVIFGVLTTNDLEQALNRAGGKLGNKGVEAAVTAIKMANIIW